MKKNDEALVLSATDLVGHLNCQYLTSLDIKVVEGALKKPSHYDPLLEILRERGQRHEDDYITHIETQGYTTTKIDGVDVTEVAVSKTREAMENGASIIVQAALASGQWHGRADILRRIEIPSALGEYSYEIIDTKLARETKAGTILQLCLYADLLETIQGIPPEFMYVVAPWSNYEPQQFRYADYAAYFRHAKRKAELAVKETTEFEVYPEPKPHCDVCRWQQSCEERRRNDDHLCLVAGITKNQIKELQANNVTTLQDFAALPSPLPFKPQRGSLASFEKSKDQAEVQLEARTSGTLKYRVLPIVLDFGLCALPAPSPGDVFFDIESDQFAGEHGIEYLFGYSYEEDGNLTYTSDWAFNAAAEKQIFEQFMDFVGERIQQFPDMHIYHFGGYEAGALKRLMGRYATREEQVDNLLRHGVLIDLLSVTRHTVRASVESYSLKKLEPFFDFKRELSLHDANAALTKLTIGLELNDLDSIDDNTKDQVAKYNKDDCLATASLRDWLEGIREELITQGIDVPRPSPASTEVSSELDEHLQRLQNLIAQLIEDVSIEKEERSEEQQGRWTLAHILDWHRRENKAVWWEYFRLKDLNADELLDEKTAIGRLHLLDTIERSKTGIPTHRYLFEPQDTDLRGGENLHGVGGDKLGTAMAVTPEDRTLDIKKTRATADVHPEAVFSHTVINAPHQAASLFRLAEYVAENGILGDGNHKAARDLLLRAPLDIGDSHFQNEDEQSLDAALRLTMDMNPGVLPIQGPPGTGKSYTGARMICNLVKEGKTVGITANSHKVIRNLIDKVIEAAPEFGLTITCAQKPESGSSEDDLDHLFFVRDNAGLIQSISGGRAKVASATPFFWSREDAGNLVDVLFVDEAGQMSLANALAVAQSAKTLILLGDPQQLEQPIQGSHPEGTDLSALDHLLAGAQTISADKGLFLGTTYRLHPKVTEFNSELFYEGKLTSEDLCLLQDLETDCAISGVGLRYLPISHEGNTSSSPEEAEAIGELVESLLSSNANWVDRDGILRPLTSDDILIIAPYNAQVFEIKKILPDFRVGTVDKFQGQEAAIAIYSMATSSFADAPRGMEFLYSANRFNVAISRAKCLAVLVGSPRIFEADCKTPRQMQLANAFCRFLELAEQIALD